MSELSPEETQDAAAGFAALMSKAADAAGVTPGSGDSEAPYGYTKDPATGEMRPKKAAGRPRKPPSVEELKAEKAELPEDAPRNEDRAPDTGKRSKVKDPPKEAKPVPQFREGVIERGINKLYRRAGKMVRVMDHDVGQALIDITRKEDPEDTTVGEAWENIARHNPRIRRVLLRMISGGDWGALFMAHAPVLLAIVMKDAIRKHIPFHRLFEAFLDGGEDGEAPADGTPFEGVTMPDMQEMMAMAQQFMPAMMSRAPAAAPRPPEAVVPDPHLRPAGPGATAAVPAASGS